MRTHFTFLLTLIAVVTFALVPSTARADGLVVVECPPLDGQPTVIPFKPPFPPVPPIMPPRPANCPAYLSVKNHNVTVAIDNQIARTHIDQTFINESSYQLEGTYIFPLPEDAAISDFAMWVDGRKLEAQVLDAAQARSIYENIVRNQRDPALLEYSGRAAFRARIFPIPPKSEKRGKEKDERKERN